MAKTKKKLEQISMFDEPKPKAIIQAVSPSKDLLLEPTGDRRVMPVVAIEHKLEQAALFDVPAIRVETPVKTNIKKQVSYVDVSVMGLVAISEGKCHTFKTISDSFGNKLRE